ncbi:hypothetical protein [Methanolobus bombayensis]|uniref:hypothetical protein n=1 Tax=Methanolobus bombayensis TaxID=38023 RepID=UPI001AE146AE|nr:hypothetical protein [Methanolobus bombayensis]MBP1909680.1 hypothetical protein [Methanolobus bombayensis]
MQQWPPSVHSTQPWRSSINENAIRVDVALFRKSKTGLRSGIKAACMVDYL